MNRLVLNLLLCLATCQLIRCASVATVTEPTVTDSSTDDAEEVFMVCSPMQSRQQLMQVLQQSSEQLKAQLISSATAGEISPSVRSNPTVDAAVDKVMQVLHPGHESLLTSSTTESAALPTAQALVFGSESVETTMLPESKPMESDQPLLNQTATDVQIRAAIDSTSPSKSAERQSSFVGQLIGLLPNQLQNSITSSISNQSLLLMKQATTTTTTTTAAPLITETPTITEATATEDQHHHPSTVMPIKFPTVSPSELKNVSPSDPKNATSDEKTEAIFEEYFGRQNNPSSLNLIMEGLKSRLGMGQKASSSEADSSAPLDNARLLDLQQALKNSNGHLKLEKLPAQHDEYDETDRHHVSIHKATAAPLVHTTTARPSLIEKLAALTRQSTTTHAPVVVKFPEHQAHSLPQLVATHSPEDHSKLIENALKEKLQHLEGLHELLDEKKKLKTTTAKPTTEYYDRPAYPSPLPYRMQQSNSYNGPPRYPSAGYAAKPYESSGYSSPDKHRYGFRPPYENQRNGYVYPIYGY